LRPAGREGEAVAIAVPPDTERKRDDPGVEPAAEAEPSSALMAETG